MGKKNELGIDNHERCQQICNKLISNGYSVWFDDYEMIGNIDKNIMKGINSCKIVLIYLTEKYVSNIINSSNANIISCSNSNINKSTHITHINNNNLLKKNYKTFIRI